MRSKKISIGSDNTKTVARGKRLVHEKKKRQLKAGLMTTKRTSSRRSTVGQRAIRTAYVKLYNTPMADLDRGHFGLQMYSLDVRES